MSDDKNPRRALILAQATWTQLQGVTQTYQAAVLRGDDEGAARLREDAQHLLEACLDLNAEAANLTRALLEG